MTAGASNRRLMKNSLFVCVVMTEKESWSNIELSKKIICGKCRNRVEGMKKIARLKKISC